jgi:hypothetical protein
VVRWSVKLTECSSYRLLTSRIEVLRYDGSSDTGLTGLIQDIKIGSRLGVGMFWIMHIENRLARNLRFRSSGLV